ncbi:hypothetical protein DPEC_G00086070 [Dallia pectoralis]|uniref:Uncharacterized protein n=1 Tax=Dallia pectoralis TaxID=75939 RepID=A0ACC2H060_DALPE|nr:hypothetical protein DPEC_G00086070 [Dallia pectoralis]
MFVSIPHCHDREVFWTSLSTCMPTSCFTREARDKGGHSLPVRGHCAQRVTLRQRPPAPSYSLGSGTAWKQGSSRQRLVHNLAEGDDHILMPFECPGSGWIHP